MRYLSMHPLKTDRSALAAGSQPALPKLDLPETVSGHNKEGAI
jgi:hypothetical protein